MSEHHAEIRWKRTTPDFEYKTYDRTHQVKFGGGIQIDASSAPEFRGKAALVNPEEQFVASLSSCHMLTFLALAALKHWVVESYEDEAVGHLEKGPTGKHWMARVVLRPRAVFQEGAGPSPEELRQLHQSSHEECFIARSVTTDVQIEFGMRMVSRG